MKVVNESTFSITSFISGELSVEGWIEVPKRPIPDCSNNFCDLIRNWILSMCCYDLSHVPLRL